MKSILTVLFFCVCAFHPAFFPAYAQDENEQLNGSAAQIDAAAKSPEGQGTVTQRLKDRFGVSDEQIRELRDKNLGYGEISIVFALARQMPGGITDANIKKIADLRLSDKPVGWGTIAQNMGLKLGHTVRQINKIARAQKSSTDDFRKTEKTEGAGKTQGWMREENSYHRDMGMREHPGRK